MPAPRVRSLRRYCDTSDGGCSPEQYTAVMAASPWFTGLVKNDLPQLYGDGSVSWAANEEDFIDRSEIFQKDTRLEDAGRFQSADKALSDPHRRYHFTLLHFTDPDSQASAHGKSDMYNQANLNSSSSAAFAPWDEYIPADTLGTTWRANSYKRAIARTGDMVSALMDKHADPQTTFLIMGDHGHVAPGGMGGVTSDVQMVPLMAYRKGSRMGSNAREARRVAGDNVRDAARFVARARLLDETVEAPSVVANDVCDIMQESVGSRHSNTCDEWRAGGTYTVSTVDIAPTVLALLGLPVPRHATGVFIDDVMGSIHPSDALHGNGYPMVGGNCTVSHAHAETETNAKLRMDRLCTQSYGAGEDPAVSTGSFGWDEATITRWQHALHYRDLYQQKLAYVRGYLKSMDRLKDWESRQLGFLAPTVDAGQFYDEGSEGRCAAYDPYNKRGLEAAVGGSHLYTIQSLEYGRCGSCAAVEKEFLTGEELTMRGKVVCTLNDWNMVKIYYVQGIKGLLTVYNREVARTKRINLARNLALTGALALVVLAAFIYLVAANTLADPSELYRRHHGIDYHQSYYHRPDVVAFLWALSLIAFYYAATTLTYYLLQNLLGYPVWDLSAVTGTPQGLSRWCAITVLPSIVYAVIVRGLYMFHYRHAEESIEAFHEAARTPLLCSPSRLLVLISAFFARSSRTSDTGKVYLIRIYLGLITTFCVLMIASLHAVYSFIVPFIYRMNHIDATNWTLRFQLITVQLMSFPLWLDTWWSLYLLQRIHVDGVSVSQLYDMRSDKEERRVGGFAPEDEDETAALNADVELGGGGGARGGRAGGSSSALVRSAGGAAATMVGADERTGGAPQLGRRGNVRGTLGKEKSAPLKELERKLAEVELDRTLCMNRIAQLEEELDTLKEAKADALTDARLNNEFLGRGFADLQALLESGFKQLEKFYEETTASGGGLPAAGCSGSVAGAMGGFGGTGSSTGTSKALVAASSSGTGGDYRSAVDVAMANLRDENSAAIERQTKMLEALRQLDDAPGGEGGEREVTAADEESFFAEHAEEIETKLRQAKVLREELTRAERQRDELSRQVSHLEREAVVAADEMERSNDDLAGVQAERDLLERKVNEVRRELHAKNKEIEAADAELRLVKSQQVRAMAKLSVQKAKAEKQLANARSSLKTLNEDKVSLFREVSNLESQLQQAHADREEARNWASTYRDMLLKVT